MTSLVISETREFLKKNQNLKTDLSLDLSPVEVLEIVKTVVQVTNVDNTLHLEKLANCVAKRFIVPKTVVLENRPKLLFLVSMNHLNTER